MSSGERHRSWWALVTAVLCCAIAAGALVGLTARPHLAVQDAATQRPALVATARHSVTFIGDSWTWGEGATTTAGGYAYRTGQQLGWKYTALGIRGSGYTQGGGKKSTFGQRIPAAAATHAEIIVVQGSLNERNSTPAALATAALSTLKRLKAAAPWSKILVIGASYVPSTPTATINWINAAISGAAKKVGLRFVNPASENWTDPASPIWEDPNHPNDIGHQLVADHVEALLRGMVGA